MTFRKRFQAAWIFLFCIAWVWPASLYAASAEPTYTLTANTKKQLPQSDIEVTISGHNLVDTYAYELNVKYDPAKLKFKSASSSFAGFSIKPIVKEGMVQFAHTKVGSKPGENGTVELGRMIFETLGKGKATLELQQVKLVNSKLSATEQVSGAQASIQIVKRKDGTSLVLNDIAGHWAEETIRSAVELGIVDGYEDNTFRPQANVNRAEFAALLVRTLDVPVRSSAEPGFSDTEHIPDWAKGYVAEAARLGIVTGYEDHTFRAAAPITRSEIAVMVARAAKLKENTTDKLAFADEKDIPEWAYPYVAAAVKADLIHGRDGNLFVPHDHATRAEAVTLLMAMYAKTQH